MNDWRDEARCREVDPEVFFPDKGENAAPAKAICGHCEVRQECLDAAVESRERYGVWGGRTFSERLPLLGLTPQNADRDEDARDRALRILLLHQGGMDMHQIAAEVGVTVQLVGRVINAARRDAVVA